MDTIDKYIPDFTQYLLGNFKLNSKNYLLTITEEDVKINANPLISSFIAYYLKNNTNVILIGNQESVNHYALIMKKFGINLLKNDNFCFVDLFYEPTKHLNKFELPLCENFPYTFNSNRSKNYFTNIGLNSENEFNLDNNTLNENITEQMKKFNNKNPTVVLIDNLSTLPILEENITDWVNSLALSSIQYVSYLYLLIN